jgi:hypothetical protein
MPAAIAPEGFEAEQSLVTFATPELTRALEPALVLPTRGLNRTTTDWLAYPECGPIVHARLMPFDILNLPGHRLPRQSPFLLQDLFSWWITRTAEACLSCRPRVLATPSTSLLSP